MKTEFLKYTIWFTDKDKLATELAARPSILTSPTNAATIYSTPLLMGTAPFKAPCITSEYFATNDHNYPLDQPTFERCSGGWFGVCFLFGSKTRYIWLGTYALAPDVVVDGGPSPVDGAPVRPIPKRRWIDGFELANGSGEGGSVASSNGEFARAASRSLQGLGILFDSATLEKRHSPIESDPLEPNLNEQWERFYVRVRRFPVAQHRLWRVMGTDGSGNGIELSLTASGALMLTNFGSAYSEVLHTSAPLVVHRWYKIDILYRFALTISAIPNFIQIYINGYVSYDVRGPGPTTGTADRGIGRLTNISYSQLGYNEANTAVVDLDDWIGARLPNVTRLLGNTTTGSKRITNLPSTARLAVGDWVGCAAAFPNGSVIEEITSSTIVTLNLAAGSTNVATEVTFDHKKITSIDFHNGSRVLRIGASPAVTRLVGTLTAGSAIVTDLPTTAGLEVGMSAHALGLSASVGAGTPAQTSGYVQAVKDDLIARGIDLVGPCGAFEITKRVAWGLRADGAGLLDKPSGNNCDGYATAVIMFEDGTGFDILSDDGGANGAQWASTVVDDGEARYRPPFNPDNAGGDAVIVSIDSDTQVTLDLEADESGTPLITFAGSNGFATSHGAAAWTGDWRLSRQRPVDTQGHTGLASSTASARLALRTDAAQEVDAELGQLGIAALRVAMWAYETGSHAVANQIGFKAPELNAGVETLSNVTMATAFSWLGAWFRPDLLINPITPLAGLELVFVKAPNANPVNIRALQATAEVIGVFGPEDVVQQVGDPAVTVVRPPIGIHNAPYPHSPWARKGTAPVSAVFLEAKVYNGNATAQDLIFKSPIHFLWIRNIAGTVPPIVWIASANGPHPGLFRGYDPRYPVDVLMDPQFIGGSEEDEQETSVRVRLAGLDNPGNAFSTPTPTTYQVVAIGDPGMRFLACGALDVHLGPSDYVSPLDSPTFTPDAVLAIQEEANNQTSIGVHFKGLGHAAAAISPVIGTNAEIASGLSMANGSLTFKTGLGASTLNQIAYMAMRRADGSGDLGSARVLQLATYTGDGSASRTVGLSPLSGRRPMFAMIVPHNAAAVVRDPAHTGTTSTVLPSSISASTGITSGAIDSLSVGSLLNALGIVYDVWVLPGSVEACNNGWSCNGEFWPVDPTVPGGPGDPGPYDPEPEEDPVDPPPTGPGIPPIIGEDFEVECKPWSVILINQALSKIGVSKAIGDIATELSTEADAARLHYRDTVTQVLRDFPWPFATRYAALALVGGTPTTPLNPDWRYSYRRPADCVFERRLVVARTGAIDPTPPPFQLSSDVAGGLILTNQPAAVLEYTYRPGCSAALGDPLWRDAMIWKLACALAPSLSRMVGIVELCDKQYQEALLKATLIVRPGNPGEEPLEGVIDLAAASQRANVDVINRALVRIGAQTIRNLATDQGREANAARSIFEAELRSTLRDHPWAFATDYRTPLKVAGTTATPVNGDWQYSYRLGADVVFVRRIVTAGGKRGFELNPPPFRLGRDATGPLMFTDQVAVTVEVTLRRDGAVSQADDLFREAFAWRLAASLAPSLSLIDPARIEQQGRGPDYQQKDPPRVGQQQRAQTARWAWAMYQDTLNRARLIDVREQHQTLDDHLPDWLTGRD